MDRLKNKIAVVTGGTSGIGLATAKEFIAQGAKVVISGRHQQAIDSTVEKLGSNALGILSDAAKVDQTKAMAEKVKAAYGRVDILFINAGIFHPTPVGQITEESFDEQVTINFRGALFTLEKFLPVMPDGASVIFLSSINAFTGMPNTAVYAACKAAINSYTRTASTELAPRKIRVNSINPGPMDTPFVEKSGLSKQDADNVNSSLANRIPLKRLGKPEDVAKLAAFIASDDASFITGVEYLIDGGLNVNSVFPV